MKEWKVVLFVLLAVWVSACSNSSETSFYGDGISFTCPAGWKIDETENLEEGYFVCVEKEGIHDSGLLIILAFDEQVDQLQYLESYQQEMKGQGVFRKLTFGKPGPGYFGAYSGISVTYEASVMGVPSKGKMTIFDVYGRTVFVSSQGAIEDEKKNEKGFKTLEKTFKVESRTLQEAPTDNSLPMEDDEQEDTQ